MKVVLLRVGIDSGSGGIQGPIFKDGSFEFVCIPDNKNIDSRTYGNSLDRNGQPLTRFFPANMRTRMASQSIHVDPEFSKFTYGDPTPPKARLRQLSKGDLLVFYAGLQGFDCAVDPGLYIVGYFEVEWAGKATDLSSDATQARFSENFHVRHLSVFAKQREDLVLVAGGAGSRLLKRAHLISCIGTDRNGTALKVLAPAMQLVFGNFGGKVSIQRSPPRWVDAAFAERAAAFVRALT